MTKNRWYRSPWLVSLGVAVLAAVWMLSGQFFHSTAGTRPSGVVAPAEPPATKVRVAELTAEPKTIDLVVNGRTAASRRVDIKAETQGRVVEIGAERGARVKRGQVLVKLAADDRPARLEEAQSAVKFRQQDYEAGRQLSEKGFRPEVKLSEARWALENAKANLARIELEIARTVIRAPFDGIVDHRPVEIGDFVKDGTSIAMIVDLDPAIVIAQVPERDIGRIKLGQAGTARIVTGQTVDGIVRFIGSVADPTTRTFRVELEVPNPERRVVEGTTAELRLPLKEVLAHRLTPAVLALDGEGRLGIKLVGADDRVEFRAAEIVSGDVDGIWVTGLPATARVIAVGHEFVAVGQRVEAQPFVPGKSGS
jgi:multidrug efflux system membrane fusion protein